VPVPPLGIGTGRATGVADWCVVGDVVGTADGVALRGAGAAVTLEGEAEGVAAGEAGPEGVGAAVAAAAAVPGAFGVAECAALDEAGAPSAVVPAPVQPASASPAATPSAAPTVTRGVFGYDRIRLLLDVIPMLNSSTG